MEIYSPLSDFRLKNFTEEQVAELKRLEHIATEKRLAYQQLDAALFENNEQKDISMVPEYSKVRGELIEAVHQYNTYLASLTKK